MSVRELPAAERAVLDAFLDRLDRQRGEDLVLRAARPLDEAVHRAALERAADVARHAGLERVVADARLLMDDWVIQLFNRPTVFPGMYEVNLGRPGTTADRANTAESLGEAVTAVILGDRLDPADRDELLGMWAELAG